MSLFLITGVASSGKTTVKNELVARGFEAYDTDGDGFAKWHNDLTGYIHPKSSVKTEDRTEDFIKIHSWKVSRNDIQQLAERARNGNTIFMCGVVANEEEISDLFKAIFALTIGDEVVEQRLSTRVHNSWGKSPHELKQTLEQNKTGEEHRQLGHIVVDASKPLETVIKAILDYVASTD